MNIQARLEEIKRNGYEFKLGEYINKGFSVFGKQAGIFIGFTVIFFIISFASGFIPFVGGLLNQLLLAPCLVAGMIFMAYKIIVNKTPQTFNDMFSAFKEPGQLVLMALINLGIALIVVVPILLIGGVFGGFLTFFETMQTGGKPDPEEMIAFFTSFSAVILIAALIMMVIGTFLSFSMYFIVIGKLSAIDAIKGSITLARKGFFWILLMFLVLGVFMIIGALPCGLGLIVAVPVYYTTVASAFCDIMKINEEEAETPSETKLFNEGLLDS